MNYNLITELIAKKIITGDEKKGILQNATNAFKGAISKKTEINQNNPHTANVCLKNDIMLTIKQVHSYQNNSLTATTDNFVCEDGSIFKAFLKLKESTIYDNPYEFWCGIKNNDGYYLLVASGDNKNESFQLYYYDEDAINYYMARINETENFSPVSDEELKKFGLIPDKIYEIQYEDNKNKLNYFGALISNPNKFFNIVDVKKQDRKK